ncbi:HlyD family secretion protein [Taibaiella soli]|uniref:HlyD family secretion protein n=2 Tax=Taibaiella soli TaxID=1649169 RepID=A0A2W2BFF9_9BACT|nr:HlyD family secretion protein [Taibaiella soli]
MAGIETAEPKKRSKGFVIVLAALVIVGGGFGITKYLHAQHHEETDDAQIDANISPVIPRVAGYISEVRVKDNQYVKKGDTLIVLDNRDYQIKVDQADAAVAAANSNLSVAQATTSAAKVGIYSAQANVTTAEAQIEAAKVNVWRANQDYTRYANLIKDHSITQQQYDEALAAKQRAERQLQVLVEQKNAASRQANAVVSQSNATGEQISVANAGIKQRLAELETAKLNLSYTVIIAPADGKISKVGVQPGQFMQAGQTMFSIVLNDAVWVVANFKETQLNKMKIGQKVTVSIDALGGHEFEATLTSFAPATGARFALLPPDNASGNFVKVVQRVPVKIEFVNTSDPRIKDLRPGMNADVDVHLD